MSVFLLIESAKLRKKLVKAKRFGKINAFRPEIKAIRGGMRKYNWGLKAYWGGLVKKLGCKIVTQNLHFKTGRTSFIDNANRDSVHKKL